MELGQSQITQVRLPDGRTVSIVDWTDKPLFSSMDLLNAFTDQEIECFTYGVSDNVSSSSNLTTRRVATEADTNVVTPGGMASTEEILVYNIKVEPFQLYHTATSYVAAEFLPSGIIGAPIPRPEVLASLAYHTLLRLEISQKIFAEAGLAYFNTGFGVYTAGSAGTNVAAGAAYGGFGLPSAEAPRSFSIPHHIGGQEKYRVVLASPRGFAGGVLFPTSAGATDVTVMVTLRILLEGLYKRPVS